MLTVDRNILPGMKPTRHSFSCGLLLLLLVLCSAAFTLHNRALEVRPGRISKTLELDYDYDMKGVIQRG